MRNKSGKRPIVFKREQAIKTAPVEVPCGQCIGCRLERSREWAVRCVHEASLHTDNCFLTLTYNDDKLPSDGSLNKEHFPAFMKRLRARLEGLKIRYFHCGEYGEENHRPHYHACLFGFAFPDRVHYSTERGVRLYYSPMLEETWGHGFCSVGELTFESAAYVARYVLKKVNGPKAYDHYLSVNATTGVISEIQPEYTTMSRRPGIAHGWYSKFASDIYPDDFVVVRGAKSGVPRFYDKRFEIDDPGEYLRIKNARILRALERAQNNTPERLAVREKVTQRRIKNLTRPV